MKKESDDASKKTVGKGAEENNDVNNPIRAADQSRNDERDKRVAEEKGTERIRSEKQSTRKKGNDRHMPLL